MEIIHDKGENLAWVHPAPTVHPKLVEHSHIFKKRIIKVNHRFYIAVGYGLANITFFEGENELGVIDTGESEEVAREVLQDLKEFVDKPITVIILTHCHLDHFGGIGGFAKKEDVDSGKVRIFAHQDFMQGIRNNASVVGPIINLRAVYSFGLLLKNGPEEQINEGLGPRLVMGTTTFIPPTHTFSDSLQEKMDGIEFHLYHAPSETNDQLFVWFPKDKVLQTADIVIPSFPNLHTPRGTKPRDPIPWYKTVDKLRSFPSQYMLPSHGPPIEGRDNIEEKLRNYRDAIQYTHDRTIQRMNAGSTPDDLVHEISELPPHLKYDSLLQEFYGALQHCTPQFYRLYIGDFHGDPTFLLPDLPIERSKKYIKCMGGMGNVYEMAEKAFEEKDYQWSAELLTNIIRVHPRDNRSRSLKAKCLRQLGFQSMNTNWRNWYLTSALELEGGVCDENILAMKGTDCKEILLAIPIEDFINRLCVCLDEEKSLNVHISLAINMDNKRFILELRRGILQVHIEETIYIPHIDFEINVTNNNLRRILLKKEGLENGKIELIGDTTLDDISFFFSHFDFKKKVARLTGPKIN